MAYRSQAGSGTLAGDEYRGSMGYAAAHCLDKGLGAACLSTDHSGANELCVETIVRKQNDLTKAIKWMDGMASAQKAADNVRSGIGVHKKQSDHAGNTCASVLAAAV